MATNQMEEIWISKTRNEGDECILRVTGEGLTDNKRLDAKHFGTD